MALPWCQASHSLEPSRTETQRVLPETAGRGLGNLLSTCSSMHLSGAA